MIIGLVGEKLSGKDITANYLAGKFQADHIRFSHVLDEIIKILNLPLSRRNEIDLGLGLRKIFGEHVLVNALHRRVEKSTAPVIAVNGIRMDEFDVVKSWPGSKIIYITAPAKVRFARYQQRHEKTDDAVMDFEQFKIQEQEPTEINIPELGKRADYRIDNTGTVEELYGKVDEIVKNIKTQK